MSNRSNIVGLSGLKNARTSTNNFDLSHRNLCTAQIGQLLPIFVQDVNPKDTITLNTQCFTRTQPLQTAAFTRIKENVQFYFVPFEALWKYFPYQVINMNGQNANDKNISRIAASATTNSVQSNAMPYVTMNALGNFLASSTSDGIPSLRSTKAWKLLQLLGYGDFSRFYNPQTGKVTKDVLTSLSNYRVSPFRLLAYQKIVNDHYLYHQWQPYNAYLCNLDWLKPSDGDLSCDAMFKYSDSQYCPADMRNSNLPLDYLNGVLPKAQFGEEASVSLGSGATGELVKTYSKAFINGVQAQINALTTKNASLDNTTDYFDVSLKANSGSNGQFYHSKADGSHKVVSNFNAAIYLADPNQKENNVLKDVSFSGGSTSADLSISKLRAAVALQRYKEIMQAADSDFSSQIEAHFGIKPNHSHDESTFIGGSSNVIEINPIVNNNLADGNNTEVKGTATGRLQASCTFTADTYGVVIGIYRAVPILDYAHIGIDRQILKTDASDFVIPELDSIGMQTQRNFELASPASQFVSGSAGNSNSAYGYANRYSEYKTSFDRYNGTFMYSLKTWVTGLTGDAIASAINRSDGNGVPQLFYCPEDICDNIFVNNGHDSIDDDQLLLGLYNSVQMRRVLSVHGLPY